MKMRKGLARDIVWLLECTGRSLTMNQIQTYLPEYREPQELSSTLIRLERRGLVTADCVARTAEKGRRIVKRYTLAKLQDTQ